jgi:arabinogalactan endo-1,4-beta-galactosidase
LEHGARSASFANGADVSWVSQQESSGYAFYNSSGVKTDPFVLLKNLQVNAIRLRVWVNPAAAGTMGRTCCTRPSALLRKASASDRLPLQRRLG